LWFSPHEKEAPMDRERLTGEQIDAGMGRISGWAREGDALTRSFRFEDFSEAFAFMTRVALRAEKLDHHPDWSNTWNRVDVKLTTHSAGGLTALDFALAAFMDEVAR
jgi:4a-hydroxytetrahydrobiopterin dehydratase